MTPVTDLTRAWAGRRAYPCTFTAETASTNDDAKRRGLDEAAPEHLYLAAHQTAGRGRGQNQWLDTGRGEALLSTWSLQVFASPQAITAPRVGLALYRAARGAWPTLGFGLKAPNDLYLDGFKIAGLLIETVSDGARFRLIVGLGLNVANHPRNLATATHLTSPADADWITFLDAWTGELRRALSEVTTPGLTPAARADLRRALNANVARTLDVTEVTAAGDLVHAGGRIPWSTL